MKFLAFVSAALVAASFANALSVPSIKNIAKKMYVYLTLRNFQQENAGVNSEKEVAGRQDVLEALLAAVAGLVPTLAAPIVKDVAATAEGAVVAAGSAATTPADIADPAGDPVVVAGNPVNMPAVPNTPVEVLETASGQRLAFLELLVPNGQPFVSAAIPSVNSLIVVVVVPRSDCTLSRYLSVDLFAWAEGSAKPS
ncbi:hypothetical protein B0H16DRAFT_1473360 [Mycena metata]|uniref:Uncharacterized protein n=1 Tax=Mycena metata TaxID=1033252 RepID=A0AAD7ML21_9AGAR|nr:hypothetical protein B0H16DRAFT_1473360 [Mycena metata]